MNIIQERLKEYEEILRVKNEDWDKKDKELKFIRAEFDGYNNIIATLEQ